MKKRYLLSILIPGFAFVILSCNRGGTHRSTETSENSGVMMKLPDDFKVDPEQSSIFWTGDAIGIYKHTGTIELTEASLLVEDGRIFGGNFTVDMTTITPTDENYNPVEGYSKEKLKGHLMSADFFDVENFPTANFIFEEVTGNAGTGILTIRDHSHPETIENIQVSKEGELIKITGDLIFNRKKYDVSWDYPMQDRVLSEDITLKITLVGN
jgi:polyisoprenoid-binding protein YceI